jgi:hypothetical protein
MYIKIILKRIFMLFILYMNGVVFGATVEERIFATQLKQAEKIAKAKEIIRDMGQNFVAISGSPEIDNLQSLAKVIPCGKDRGECQ